jgi:hypothetical protein
MEGLILLPSGKSKGEFQRVGYMSVLLERQRPVHISECSTSNSSASWWDGAFTRVIDPSIYVEHESPDSHTIVLM